MQNKNEGSENKIMLEDLNCTMDKTDRDGEKKKKHKYFIGLLKLRPDKTPILI